MAPAKQLNTEISHKLLGPAALPTIINGLNPSVTSVTVAMKVDAGIVIRNIACGAAGNVTGPVTEQLSTPDDVSCPN